MRTLPVLLVVSVLSTAGAMAAYPTYAADASSTQTQPSNSLLTALTTPITQLLSPQSSKKTGTGTGTTNSTNKPAAQSTTINTPVATATVTVPDSSDAVQTQQSQPTSQSTPESSSSSTNTPTSTSADANVSSQSAASSTVSPQSSNSGTNLSQRSSALANAQVISSGSETTYSSNQLNPEVANRLYQIAGGTALIGLLMYALSAVPLRRFRLPSKVFHSKVTN